MGLIVFEAVADPVVLGSRFMAASKVLGEATANGAGAGAAANEKVTGGQK